jgi:hypothetical protein
MSRYPIPAQDPRYEVVVGWDDPLDTFFGQVFDTTAGEDEEACVYWEGAGYRACQTVDALQASLSPFATIPDPVVAQLRADQQHAVPRSPFQEQLLRLFIPDAEERRYGKPQQSPFARPSDPRS